ncbi:hypothetical protein B0J17DRAFT_653272 [Rhizoctonia solani]|nr:hypothetical protein B0J17DRAFT_653272 [Rhizoctonia solani]
MTSNSLTYQHDGRPCPQSRTYFIDIRERYQFAVHPDTAGLRAIKILIAQHGRIIVKYVQDASHILLPLLPGLDLFLSLLDDIPYPRSYVVLDPCWIYACIALNELAYRFNCLAFWLKNIKACPTKGWLEYPQPSQLLSSSHQLYHPNQTQASYRLGHYYSHRLNHRYIILSIPSCHLRHNCASGPRPSHRTKCHSSRHHHLNSC